MFKANNKDTRITLYLTPCSSVSIDNFEQVNVGWVQPIRQKSYQRPSIGVLLNKTGAQPKQVFFLNLYLNQLAEKHSRCQQFAMLCIFYKALSFQDETTIILHKNLSFLGTVLVVSNNTTFEDIKRFACKELTYHQVLTEVAESKRKIQMMGIKKCEEYADHIKINAFDLSRGFLFKRRVFLFDYTGFVIQKAYNSRQRLRNQICLKNENLNSSNSSRVHDVFEILHVFSITMPTKLCADFSGFFT